MSNLKKQPSSFDITAYTVEFNSVFFFKEIQECFLKHLETEFNTDPFKCVLAINELNELNNDEEIIEKCRSIISNYVAEKSTYEVNTSVETKKQLLDSMNTQLDENEWILDETAYEIFYPLKKILISELNADNFPRFVRSESFIQMAEKYVNDPRVMKTITSLKYPFTDEHFEKPFVSTHEMEFMNQLFLDSYAWETVYSKPSFQVYTSQMQFLPDSKFFANARGFKFQAMLPHSFEKVTNLFLSQDYLKEIDPSITDFSVRETYSISNLSKKFPDDSIANQVHSIIAVTCIQPHFPFNTPRKSIDVYCVAYDNEERCLTYIGRPFLGDFKGKNIDWTKKMKFDHVDKSGEKKTVEGYITASHIMIKIKIVDQSTTSVSIVMCKTKKISKNLVMDPKGYLTNSSKLIHVGAKMLGNQMEKMFQKSLKKIPDNVSMESFKNLKSEPMLNLVYKVLKKNDSFAKLDQLFEHSYSDLDFKKPYITDLEYNYFATLVTSSVHWDLIYHNLDDKIYYSKSPFLPNSKLFNNTTNIMIQRIIDCPIEAFCTSFFSFSFKQQIQRFSTKIQVLQKVNLDDVPEEDRPNISNPSFIISNDKYSSFPKFAKKVTCVDSTKMSKDGSKVFGLSRPYIGDLQQLEEFNEKLKFKVTELKSDKEIEVEGTRSVQLQFAMMEKLNENQTKFSTILIVDPNMVAVGKSAIKIMMSVFGKFLFKKIDDLRKDIPKHFSLSSININEDEEPLIKILQNSFAELYKRDSFQKNLQK